MGTELKVVAASPVASPAVSAADGCWLGISQQGDA